MSQPTWLKSADAFRNAIDLVWSGFLPEAACSVSSLRTKFPVYVPAGHHPGPPPGQGGEEIVKARRELQDRLFGLVTVGTLERLAEVLRSLILAAVHRVSGAQFEPRVGELQVSDAFGFRFNGGRVFAHRQPE